MEDGLGNYEAFYPTSILVQIVAGGAGSPPQSSAFASYRSTTFRALKYVSASAPAARQCRW